MRTQGEISVTVCAMILLLSGSGCSTISARPCANNDECVDNASCSVETGWCEFWKNPLIASRNEDWKDATIGNPYEVEYAASGGFPPYTWVLNDGQTITHLEWLTLATEGDNNEKAKLQNKVGSTPGPGDINTSGIPIKITIKDYTKPGNANRADNNGVNINEMLKIKGCPQNDCNNCLTKSDICIHDNYGKAECNNSTIRKCWADSDGCLVWQNENRGCSGHETCTVAGDGVVSCTCNTGWAAEKCDQCAQGYIEYPNCRIAKVGDSQSISIAGVTFNMKWVPGGAFPAGTGDDGTANVGAGFWMGETEVTYEFWNAVYKKAAEKGYTFANSGREGNDGVDGAEPTGAKNEPVTYINWRDAMVWCNLASELAELTAVYYTDAGYTTPIRSVDNSITITTTWGTEDNPYVNNDANGFRLPESMEWECAARYRGTDSTNSVNTGGTYWTKGNSASGAYTYYNDAVNGKAANDQVAVYGYYWDGATSEWVATGVTSTAAVKSKGDNGKNALGIYDMSGNVWEWCFDWYASGSSRVVRGGTWNYHAIYLQVGFVDKYSPDHGYPYIGFRLVGTK